MVDAHLFSNAELYDADVQLPVDRQQGESGNQCAWNTELRHIPKKGGICTAVSSR